MHKSRITRQLEKVTKLHERYIETIEDDADLMDSEENWMEDYFQRATDCIGEIDGKLQSAESRSVSGMVESIDNESSSSSSMIQNQVSSGSTSQPSSQSSQPHSESSQYSSESSQPLSESSQPLSESSPSSQPLSESSRSSSESQPPSDSSWSSSESSQPPSDSSRSLSESSQLPLESSQSSSQTNAAASTSGISLRSSNVGIDDWIDHLVPGVETDIGMNLSTTDLSQTIAKLEIDRDLPKVELPYFDGSPLTWPRFIEQFYVQVHSRRGLTDSRRMDLLQSHVKSDAKTLIQGLGYSRRNYALSLQELKFAFGHKVLVARAYINSVTSGSVVESGDVNAIRSFYIVVRDGISTLQQMKYQGELRSNDVLQRALRRIPNDRRNSWNELIRKVCQTREPTLLDLQTWLKQRVEADSNPYAIPYRVPKGNNSHSSPQFTAPKVTTLNTSANTSSVRGSGVADSKACVACGEAHHTSRCKLYTDMSAEARYEFVKERRLCFNCLYPNHRIGECSSSVSCKVSGCKKRHHTSLHRGRSNSTSSVAHVNHLQSQRYRVYFQVLPVVVHGSNGRKLKTYALLDSASDISMINYELSKDLGLSGKQSTLTVNTLSSTMNMQSTHVSFAVQDSDDLDAVPLWLNEVWTKQSSFSCPRFTASRVKDMSHLQNLNLSNIEASEVKILIGANVPRAHMQLEVREGRADEPVAIRTCLGWCLMGVAATDPISNDSACVNLTLTEDENLSRQVERFWQTESFGVCANLEQPRSVEDQRALQVMDEKTRFIDGHYEVPMLWRKSSCVLPNNRAAAEKRFTTLTKKLSRDPELESRYSSAMQGYINKGYARKMDPDEVDNCTERTWYLPHHSVVNSKKPGKVRVVFDAAATYKGTSLNNSLLTGPDLLNSLFGVLQRFRTKPIAVVGDITDMFYQVKVPVQDSDSLRFLWKDNIRSNDAADVYKMSVHIFGAKDSPCCANYALRRVADDIVGSSDVVKEAILKNFYVDDLLKSVDDVDSACNLVCELNECLSASGFKIRKWMSSSREVLFSIPEADRARPDANLEFSVLPVERALGVEWDVQEDAFMFAPTVMEGLATKRTIVSTVTSIFDPCGFLNPFTFSVKCLIQDLWRERYDWDDVIHSHHLARWNQWLADFTYLSSLRIPRYHGFNSSSDKAEIHIFCDASEAGFAASAYLRLVGSEIRCSFVAAKSHVAPVKTILMIPKLELQGAVMAVRLSETLKKEMDIDLNGITYWTDAMTVLKYINNESRRWKVFVGNTVSEIREKSYPSQWKYVSTTVNPADAATRGLSARDLTINSVWFQGPEFLWLPEDKWPDQPIVGVPAEDDPNVRKCTHVNAAVVPDVATIQLSLNPTGLVDPGKFSSWFKLSKHCAWILRAVKNFVSGCRRFNVSVVKRPWLTVKELKGAEFLLMKDVQMESFTKEYKDLSKNIEIQESSNVKSLHPFFDISDGVIRVGGRLKNSERSFETRHQVLLPYDHHVTKLIIRAEHLLNGHAGTEQLVALLRRRYWIIKCRTAVRQCIHLCMHCRRYTVKPRVPLMAELPVQRVCGNTVAFEFSGVDYFGPMIVKRDRARQKKWGCLFTCLVTRAVHLELADSLEADDFILALRCFVGRRGKPSEIFSDNGKNFVGAHRELQETLSQLDQSNILQNFLLRSSIQWHFIPPNAPHYGGAWERLVRSTKTALKAIVKEQCVTENVLRTALIEVEDIINSRPLTYNSSDPNDFTALTPNHFLRLGNTDHVPPGSFHVSAIDSRRRWRQPQVLADHIWKRWMTEYLPSLTVRNKWKGEERNHLVGDLVLLVDENRPRGQWSMGRIVEVFPSEDGRIRAMKLKTPHGVYVRPAAKVCLLEEAITT